MKYTITITMRFGCHHSRRKQLRRYYHIVEATLLLLHYASEGTVERYLTLNQLECGQHVVHTHGVEVLLQGTSRKAKPVLFQGWWTVLSSVLDDQMPPIG